MKMSPKVTMLLVGILIQSTVRAILVERVVLPVSGLLKNNVAAFTRSSHFHRPYMIDRTHDSSCMTQEGTIASLRKQVHELVTQQTNDQAVLQKHQTTLQEMRTAMEDIHRIAHTTATDPHIVSTGCTNLRCISVKHVYVEAFKKIKNILGQTNYSV